MTVYGVVCQRWKPFHNETICEVELVLKANNIEVNNQQTTATLMMEDIQKEFKAFWESCTDDPIAGMIYTVSIGMDRYWTFFMFNGMDSFL